MAFDVCDDPLCEYAVDRQRRIDVRVEHGQERDERRGVVLGDLFGDDVPAVHVEGGDDGYRAVADVLELASGHAAWPGALHRVCAAAGADRCLLIDLAVGPTGSDEPVLR
ncbi:hypothetical protein [Micromonospora sp. NPDC049274]|uniref:hypothetical protein n=1 Tax=Micromonospora sp. NPDC049274 TaxID=3154829 RepID=UPI0034318389